MINSELEFEQVFAIFQPKIYRYLTRLIGVKEAEDLTQEVFIKVGKALGTCNNQSQLSAWIYQIATNAAIDKMKSRAYKREITETCSVIERDLCEEHVCSYKKPLSVEEQVIRKEMNTCIQEYVEMLPENYRTVFILSEFGGLKDSEIATILELSTGTVKIRLHRAKVKLKELLSANCNFYRTECNELACEPKGPTAKTIKAFTVKKSTD
jgi:RNA polymerase sigma-70 factor (ECF subfamily)